MLAQHEKLIQRLEANPCDDTQIVRNVGDIGSVIDGTLGSTVTLTLSQDVLPYDGIMVAAHAPSLPSVAATEGFPVSCSDSAGNTYSVLLTRDYQHSPAQVNTGAYTVIFFCPLSYLPMDEGVATISVTWDNPVYDRFVYAWNVRHVGGASIPQLLGSTASNDMAVYAASTMSVTMPAWTPARDNSLAFALFLVFRPNIPGWAFSIQGDFFMAKWGRFTGSQQDYIFMVQTYGANAYIVVEQGGPEIEIDQGYLPGGVLTAAGKIAKQSYSSTNDWKGIRMFGVE